MVTLVVCLSPAPVAAQDQPRFFDQNQSFLFAQDRSLRAATIAAGAAAAADWASTYHALKNYQMREMNPLLRPIDHAPGAMVTVGALIDVGGIAAWNLTVGKKHPKLAAIGLWATTGFRTYLAFRNFQNEQKAIPR